jgi:uncharacterized protein involved in outer membrane biogenesis
MRKLLRVAAFLTAAVVLFFVVVALAFYHLVRTGEFRRYLIAEIEQKTELKLQLGEADLELGGILGISFRDVAIAESDVAAPALSAERVTARVAFWPLLNRRLVFFQVHLKNPHARLVRDRSGKIPLLERLLNLPFLKQDTSQFAFDLRTVAIADGEVEFTDHYSESAPVTTRLHRVALVLERVRGQALREFVAHWVAPKEQPPGAALKFDLGAGVEWNGQQANFRAQGKLVFPEKTFDLARAWHNLDARIEKMPATMVGTYGVKLQDVKFLEGALGAQLHIEGNRDQRLNIRGKVDFQRLSLDAPEWFAAPVQAGDGQIQLDIRWQPGQWDVSRLDYRSKELALGVKGQLSRVADGDTRLRLDLTGQPLAMTALKKYFPARWLAASKIAQLVSAATEGQLQIHKAGVNASAAAIRGMLDSGSIEGLSFDAEVRNAGGDIPGGYPPVRAVNGRIALERGRFAFSNWRGVWGRTRFTDVDGRYDYAPATAGAWQMRARGEADLGELREQAQRGLLPAEMAKPLLSVQALGGRVKFDANLNRSGDGAPVAEANLELDGARLQWDKFSFTDIDGDVAVTRAQIKTDKARARISGSPVTLRLELTNYMADDGLFDLTVDSTGVRAGIVSTLLLERGSLQDPGIVRGAVRYRGSFHGQRDNKLTGNLELINVQLALQPLLQPLRRLHGKIAIDENGIDFQNMQGLLVGVPASASGRWYYTRKPQLVFDFAAGNLDINYLISQIDPEATDFYADLQAEGRVVLGRSRIKSFELTDVKSNLILDRRYWQFPNFTARADGGAVSVPLKIMHKPDAIGINAEARVQNVPLATFMRWFDMATSEITGTVDVAGKIDTFGRDDGERKRNLSGAFNLKIANGTIHRMRILVQLLNILDLSRWFSLQLPDLGKQGIRFRTITGDFKINQGVYSTENLLVDSDDLRMTGAGKIDPPNGEIDFLVAVRPFAGIDTAITRIPLLGRGIAAIKNSFLVASFNISGQIDDPTITPAPLGTLSEMVWGVLRIPKSLIPFFGDEIKTDKEWAQEKPPVPNR